MDTTTLSVQDLNLKRRSLRRQLSAVEGLHPVRIAVLGGSTTQEVTDFFELHLLASGFRPTFYQSEYGRFYEDAVLDVDQLKEFAPDLVYLHTSWRNVLHAPPVSATEEDLAAAVAGDLDRYRQIWASLKANLSCQILQNNFDAPPLGLLGNLDAVVPGGATRFYAELNAAFAREAAADPRLLLHDLASLAAQVGLRQWHDSDRWFSYKLPYTVDANVEIARSLTAMVRTIYGRARKVLVLDLDNTLWGGVIGDDGVDRIHIGRETPLAEAFTAFQEYCLTLRNRGVLLAVCSKNDDAVARSGFDHPDSVLRLEHLSAFRANWAPKHENLASIAQELNLGIDSFVFADDNPAERAIVSAQLPQVAVPDIGNNPAHYASILEAGRYFEAVSLSKEDLSRAAQYAANFQRAVTQATFSNYGEYLDSLEMTAEVDTFQPVYLDRITQLTNKTNQFNLTTRRYTQSEIESIATDRNFIGLYGRLIDRFGDNGLISVVLGRIDGTALHLDLWLMSCRVLKREMELAMLDRLVEHAAARGVRTLVGYYIPTKKNGMVAEHYQNLGFHREEPNAAAGDGSSTWTLHTNSYTLRTRHIKLTEAIHG